MTCQVIGSTGNGVSTGSDTFPAHFDLDCCDVIQCKSRKDERRGCRKKRLIDDGRDTGNRRRSIRLKVRGKRQWCIERDRTTSSQSECPVREGDAFAPCHHIEVGDLHLAVDCDCHSGSRGGEERVRSVHPCAGSFAVQPILRFRVPRVAVRSVPDERFAFCECGCHRHDTKDRG